MVMSEHFFRRPGAGRDPGFGHSGFSRVRNTSPELSKGSCRGGLDPGLRRDDKEGDKWIVSQSPRAGDRESRSKSGVVVNA